MTSCRLRRPAPACSVISSPWLPISASLGARGSITAFPEQFQKNRMTDGPSRPMLSRGRPNHETSPVHSFPDRHSVGEWLRLRLPSDGQSDAPRGRASVWRLVDL